MLSDNAWGGIFRTWGEANDYLKYRLDRIERYKKLGNGEELSDDEDDDEFAVPAPRVPPSVGEMTRTSVLDRAPLVPRVSRPVNLKLMAALAAAVDSSTDSETEASGPRPLPTIAHHHQYAEYPEVDGEGAPDCGKVEDIAGDSA